MKANRLLFYLLFLLLFTVGCQKDEDDWPEFNLESADLISEEEYSIYSKVINEYYADSSTIVISQCSQKSFSLGLHDLKQYFLNNALELDTTIFLNFKEINDTTYLFDKQYTVSGGAEIILLSTDEFLYMFDQDDINEGWYKFYGHYPKAGGILGFSRIGFNDLKTQAIFEVSFSYASLGGGGSIVFLEKVDDEWFIVSQIGLWES